MTKIRSSDGSNMDDRRGQGGGGGMSFPGLGGGGGGGGGGFPIPGGMKAGGGLLGLIVVLAVLFLPRLLGGGSTDNGAVAPVSGQASELRCTTDLEQVVCGVTNDVQRYWRSALPTFFGTEYRTTKTRLFDQPYPTGCGEANPQTGPFYCPADELIYIDLGFMQQIEQQFVGRTSDLAEQYILAHEYGHHVQHLLGTNDEVDRLARQHPSKANRYSVALELQADCYAGVWVGDANKRGLLDSPAEISEAIDAAEGVGDDRIQLATQGRIDPESWTHGSAEERRTWFLTGFDTQDPTTCDTFAALP